MAGPDSNPHGTVVTLPNGQAGTIPPPTAIGQGAVIVYENWTGRPSASDVQNILEGYSQ